MEVSRQIKVPVEARGCCPRLHQASAVANYSPTDNFLPESAAAMILLDCEVQGWQGVGERQFWWHPLSWSPYVLKFLQRWATWVWMDFSVSSLFRCPLSQQSETSQMIFFCFSKDYSCLDVCSYLLSTFKYLSRIKRKQDQPFDKMYLKVLTLPFTILHYTYALLYVQNIRFESEIILIIELYNTTSVFLGDTKCYWQARVLQCESCFLIYK